MTVSIPQPLLWELTKNRSAFTVKRRSGGGAEFSTDPLNLTNKHSYKQDGYINDRAVGVAPGPNGGVSLLNKKKDKSHAPKSGVQSSTFGTKSSSRSTHRKIANAVGGRGYRSDLNSHAVKRASAISKSQKEPKKDHPAKLRGVKAKKAAEESS